MGDINPERGNKRPSRAVCQAAGGKFSSRKVHQSLSNLNEKYDEFLAESGGDSSDCSDPDDEGL